jgi:hypothetical protein
MGMSIIAFEVNVDLVRSELFTKGGAFSKPKPPTVDALIEGLDGVWKSVDDQLTDTLGAGSFIRYFYGVSLVATTDQNSAVENSFIWSGIASPDGLTDPRVFEFRDREDYFVKSQIVQVIKQREKDTTFEIGIAYLTNLSKTEIEQIFKDVYLDFSGKQKGELHLFTFMENGMLSVSLANFPDGKLEGTLAGEDKGRMVIPPFLMGLSRRIQAAVVRFMTGLCRRCPCWVLVIVSPDPLGLFFLRLLDSFKDALPQPFAANCAGVTLNW